MFFREQNGIDRRRDRTCNLLIRSQAPCHWASRPGYYGLLVKNVRFKRKRKEAHFCTVSMHLIGEFILTLASTFPEI
ncbi:hypothetical protein ACN42_g7581 [Penicillium freii]|uniref:Uncharacterized protein n=1 Tax=Penicillium freii TaxID=48697 RepID=A0A101MFI4_PENFR|nr:hypothetical protein ACN42_g7581 [Penicillium freii]